MGVETTWVYAALQKCSLISAEFTLQKRVQ